MVVERLEQLTQHRLYRNAYALVGNNLLVAVGSYLFWITSAQRFTEEAVGIASAALSSMAVLTIIADLGLGMGLIRFLPDQASQHDGDELVRAALTVRIGVTAVAVSIFLLSVPWAAPGLLVLRQQPGLGMLLLMLTLINSIFLLQTSVFVATHRARYVLIAGLIFSVTKLVGLFFGSPIHGVPIILLSVTGALAISVLYSGLVASAGRGPRSLPSLRFSVRKLRGFFGYSLVNHGASLLLETPGLLLPIFVLNFLGARANAHFYTAWMMVSILRTACASVAQSAFAEGAATPTSLYSNLWRSLGLSLLLIVVAGTVLALLGPSVLLLFGVGYAAQGGVLLGWLILAVLPFSFVNLFVTALRVEKNTKLLLLSATVVATTSIGGALWGINVAGLEGLAIGWLGAQFLAMVSTGALFLRGRAQVSQAAGPR